MSKIIMAGTKIIFSFLNLKIGQFTTVLDIPITKL